MNPTINTYFSGIGVGDAGLIRAGVNIGQSFEIDPIACRVQRENLGAHVVQADLTQTLVLDEIQADGAVFTYPCTKYSAIADIHSARTGDELFLHALRRLAIARPEVYAVENVPGMRKFPIVMEAMTKMPDYYIQVFCPIQSSTWLPQRRDRLIIIGSKRRFNWRPPEGTKQTPLADILEKDPRVTLPKAIQARMAGKYRDLPIISDPSNDGVGYTAIIDAADLLGDLETQCDFLRNEYGDICELVKFKSAEHDSLTNAVAIALDKQKKYTALSAIDYLQSMISGVFCNDTKIVIFDTESPEIIISTNTDELRYEIPTGSESETDQFIESLAWISGQLIEDAS